MTVEIGNMVARVSIDQTGFQQGISKLNRELKVVQSEFKASSAQLGDFGKGTEGLKIKADSLTKQLDIQKQKVQALEGAYKKSVDTKGADAKATQNLEIRLNKAKAEMAGLDNELKKTTAELEKQSSAWHKVSKACQETGSKMTDIGKTLATRVTLPLAALGTGAAKSAIDIESAFAGVRKTVDATEGEFAKLKQGFIDMSTDMKNGVPLATEGLMEIGEAAGQLGIHKEAILGFSEVMAKLGVATNLSGEQAAMSLARLANIIQMPQDQFDRLGSTIVDLGNNLATTEAEIVEMGLRLAGAGNITGMTEAQVLSFAGALSSVGVEAEAGGTAFSRVMLEINNEVMSSGKNLQVFAAVAGMSAQEFSEQWKTNAAGALVAFIEGLGRINQSGENVVPVLEQLGLGEIRVRDALLRAAGAGDLFAKSLEIGSQAWEENNALNKEAEERFKTTAMQLQFLKNNLKMAAAAFGEVLLPAINSVVGGLAPALDGLSGLPGPAKKASLAVAALAAAFPPLLLGAGLFVKSIPTLKSGLESLLLGVKNLGKAMLWLVTNPIGIAITALGLLVVAGIAVYKNWDTVKYYGLQAWGNLKFGVLKAIDAIAGAYEKLYGWMPVLGNKIREVHAKIRKSIEEEQAILENRVKPVKGSGTSYADFRKLEEDSKLNSAWLDGLQLTLDDTVLDMGRLSDAMDAAGAKSKKSAKDAKTAWSGTADAVRNALGILQSQHEAEIIRAEMAGDKVAVLRLKYSQLNEEVEKQKQVVVAARAEVDKAIAAGVQEGETKEDLAKRIDELNKKLADEEKAQATMEKQAYDTAEAMKAQSKGAKDLVTELKKVWEAYNTDMAKALEDYQKKVKDTNEALKKDTESLQRDLESKLDDIRAKGADRERQVTEQFQKELENRTRSLMNFVGLFDEVTQKTVSGETLLANLKGQVGAFEDWQENIQALAARGIDEGLLQELREMGPKAGPEIAALNTLTDEQLTQYVSLWKQKQEQAREEATTQLAQQRQEMNSQLSAIRQDTQNQLEQQRQEIAQKLQEMQAKAKEELEKYRLEWEKKNEEIRKNTEKNVKDIHDKFNDLVGKSSGYGVSLMENFMAGIDSKMPALVSKLESITEMIDSYMPHSPAKRGPLRRLNEWGPSLVGTFAEGIKRSLPSLENVTARMAMLSPGVLQPAIANSYSNSTSYGPSLVMQPGAIQITSNNPQEVEEVIMRVLHKVGIR